MDYLLPIESQRRNKWVIINDCSVGKINWETNLSLNVKDSTYDKSRNKIVELSLFQVLIWKIKCKLESVFYWGIKQ